MRNLEIKTYLQDYQSAKILLEKLGAKFHSRCEQTDIYFKVQTGRLKLRCSPDEATLISYNRENFLGSKLSYYSLTPIALPDKIGKNLEDTLGVLVRVVKNREVWFWKNSKIHLDNVLNLGWFFEIEVVDMEENLSQEMMQEEMDQILGMLKGCLGGKIPVSYSDLMLEKDKNFEMEFKKDAKKFIQKIYELIEKTSLKEVVYPIDHLCFRCSTEMEYEELTEKVAKFSMLLTESLIGGRKISTFRLLRPISYKDQIIRLIEIPAPKKGRPYSSGFEHLEFVTGVDFNLRNLVEKFPMERWDYSSQNGNLNHELRLQLNESTSVKFHQRPLDEVIEIEEGTVLPSFIGHFSKFVEVDNACYPKSDELLSIGSAVGKKLGLKKIGIHIEQIPPGRRTSWPHCEKEEEEFAFVIQGVVTAWVNGKKYPLKPGHFVAFPSGTGITHTFINESKDFVLLLVGGEATKKDNRIYYSHHPERNLEMKEMGLLWEEVPGQDWGQEDAVANQAESKYYS